MKYRYRNRKTGEIVTTTNRVSGKNWEPIEDNPVMSTEDDFQDDAVMDSEDDFQEETVTEEEPQAAPVEKTAAKSSRKGKK